MFRENLIGNYSVRNYNNKNYSNYRKKERSTIDNNKIIDTIAEGANEANNRRYNVELKEDSKEKLKTTGSPLDDVINEINKKRGY